MSQAHNAAAHRTRIRSRVDAYKVERGCVVCGIREHPGILDLHHLDPSMKTFGVSRAMRDRRAWHLIETELSKCVVVCANHHRLIELGVIQL